MLKIQTSTWLASAAVFAVLAAASQPAIAHNHTKAARWHRAHVVQVDAPFTRVETRRWASTAVDAPFTSVRVDRRRGVWVRAPFVNLYVPR